ncbi:hypothetical protein H263_14075 [Brachyspira hampsonii 30599]|nr:hypothetical protein H263_14075 [Brachyspira hampsonii 30599]
MLSFNEASSDTLNPMAYINRAIILSLMSVKSPSSSMANILSISSIDKNLAICSSLFGTFHIYYSIFI